MKPRLRYHPTSITQCLRFVLLGIRAAISSLNWLFLRIDEKQLNAHNEKDPEVYASVSIDLALVRRAMLELRSAREAAMTLRTVYRREERFDRHMGIPFGPIDEPPRRKTEGTSRD